MLKSAVFFLVGFTDVFFSSTIKCYRKLLGCVWILLMFEYPNLCRTLLESVDYFLKVDQKNRDIELGCFSWWGLTLPQEELRFSRDPWFFLKIPKMKDLHFSVQLNLPIFFWELDLCLSIKYITPRFSKGKLLGSAGDTTSRAPWAQW